MIELYVKLNHVQSDWNDELFADSQPDSSNAPWLISQQSCIANTLPVTSRPASTINFNPIPTDDEEDDDNDDYNVELDKENEEDMGDEEDGEYEELDEGDEDDEVVG